MKNFEIKKYKLSLIDTKQKLEKLSKATEGSRKPVQLDQTSVGRLSRIDSIQRQAMKIETERRRISEINLINRALIRIRDDKFGQCLSCSETIEKNRLQHNPATLYCLECALDNN